MDIPIAKCICKDSQGYNFETYVTNTCLPKAPEQSRTTIQLLLDSPATHVQVCNAIVAFTQSKVMKSMDPFFLNQYLAADHIGSSLDYLIRIGMESANLLETDLCSNYQTNPFVVAIIPEPVDYFRACGQTSLCRARCKPEIEAFEAANKNPSIITQTYTVRTNSPFFLELDEGAVTPMTILAMTALEDCESVCGKRLPTDSPDQCLAIAGGTESTHLTVMTYCVPSLPAAGVRRAETWSIPGTNSILNTIVSIKFLDTVHGESLLVLRENNEPGENGELLLGQNKLEIFKKGDVFISSDAATNSLIDEHIFMSVLSTYISTQQVASIRMQSIQTILVQPQTPSQKQSKHVSIFVDISASVQMQRDNTFSNVRFNFCGDVHIPSGSFSASQPPRQCDSTMWTEINGRHAVFVAQDMLAIIPSDNAGSSMSFTSSDGQIHFVQVLSLSSTKILGKRYSRPFQSSSWSLTSGIPSATPSLGFSRSFNALVRKMQQISQVGRITEFAQGNIDIFDDGYDTSVINRVPIKVNMFMSNNPTSPTHWLSQIRLDIPLTGETTATSFMSQEVSATMELKQKCNYQTCNGCVDLNVQRLCYGAQQCTIARCIGTLTNQNRPLCGIGKTAEALYITQMSLIQGAYNIVVETVSTLIGFGLKNYEEEKKIGILRWMDDAFFSTMCSAKDAIASFVSILTSVINFVVQSVTQKPVTYLEMGAQRVDSNFQSMFTLVITAFNNLLNQMFLGYLYPFFALQKTTICQLNTVMAFVDVTGYKLTIGMPEIQVRFV